MLSASSQRRGRTLSTKKPEIIATSAAESARRREGGSAELGDPYVRPQCCQSRECGRLRRLESRWHSAREDSAQQEAAISCKQNAAGRRERELERAPIECSDAAVCRPACHDVCMAAEYAQR